MTDQIPITLLTGFLGSGKSTLLSHVLAHRDFANTAVIINEYGDVGLDDFLVVHAEEQIVEMTTGCLCCTVRGDVTDTLLNLMAKAQDGSIKAFNRIIIETTGLADPAPVVHTLATDQRLMEYFALNNMITTLDATNGLLTLDDYEESIKQVALADQIILTKTDMDIDEAGLHDLKVRVSQLNPIALLYDRNSHKFDLLPLFEKIKLDKKAKAKDLQKWLGDDKLHHHHHSGSSIHSFSIVIEDAVSQTAFVLALQLLISRLGKDLLRIKGIICLQECPEKPIVIHGVQHIFHQPIELEDWPLEDHRTRLVFITRGVDKITIETYFQTWMNPQHVEMLKEIG